MTNTDEQIGRNLARLRGDMSQKELAEHMRALGWKWSQATVWTIERGERPLRLAEAQDVLNVLGSPGLYRLISSDGGSRLQTQIGRVARAHADLRAAMGAFIQEQGVLAIIADEVALSHDSPLAEPVDRWLRTTMSRTAREVVDEASAEADVDIEEWGAEEVAREDSGPWVRVLTDTFEDDDVEHQQEG